jgi:NAD(P)-dependent dehydrogenase (short-subunit alcohol dehydrogenase family)
MKLAGRVAHVTGAAAGIGRAIAVRLAAEGAVVAVSDVDEAGGRETVRRIENAGGSSAFVRADVAGDDDVRGMIAFTERSFGGLDALVNNAGGAPGPHFPEAPPQHWRRWVDVNLHGVMLGTWHGVRALRRRGGGAILNVSSIAAVGFAPYEAPEYAAAKAAVVRLTAALGTLADEGVRVNCICPDWVETERSVSDPDAPATLVPADSIARAAVRLLVDERIAGRVLLCPHEGEWGLVPLGDAPAVEPFP